MASIDVHTALELGHLPAGDRLRAVLASALGKVDARAQRSEAAAHWPAEHFGLDRVSAFVQAPAAVQDAILVELSTGQLEEAWYIEKCGLAYMAQMALLATSTEERQLYNLFCADEATHFQLIDGLLAAEPGSPSAFHDLLAEVIDSGDRGTLVFVIQVVLEGWGLTHYRQLMEGTTTPAVRDAFARILADEARHHGAGNVLLETVQPDVALCASIMERFLTMVKAGPVSVRETLSRHGLSASDDELAVQQHVTERIGVLRGLMRKPGAAAVVAELDARGAWA